MEFKLRSASADYYEDKGHVSMSGEQIRPTEYGVTVGLDIVLEGSHKPQEVRRVAAALLDYVAKFEPEGGEQDG